MSKTPHVDRLVDLGLWGEVARLAELLGRDQLELMLRARYALRRFDTMNRNPLTMKEAAPLLRRALKRAEVSRREAERVNESRREQTNRRKLTAQTIVEGAIKKDPSLRLPGKQTKLANHVKAGWPKHDKAPAISTIRHWLAEMRLKK